MPRNANGATDFEGANEAYCTWAEGVFGSCKGTILERVVIHKIFRIWNFRNNSTDPLWFVCWLRSSISTKWYSDSPFGLQLSRSQPSRNRQERAIEQRFTRCGIGNDVRTPCVDTQQVIFNCTAASISCRRRQLSETQTEQNVVTLL